MQVVPLSLYLIRHPRTLVLVSSDYCLLFKPAPATKASDDAGSVSIVMEFLERDEVDLESAVLLHSRVSGCLGVLAVGNETFLSIITHAIPLGSTYSRPFLGPGTEPINRILAVDFFCLTSPSFDYLHAPISSVDSYSASPGNDSFEDAASLASSSSSSLRTEPTPNEHPCQGIRKILSNSSFYFSSGADAFDLSTRLQARLEKAPQGKAAPEAADRGSGDDEPSLDGYDAAEIDHDARFLWNTYLVAPILSFRSSLPLNLREEFDRQGFMVLAIQGYAGTYDVTLGGESAVLSLVSRLGWKRSGTRFNVRGVDDDGSVANFVETETILRTRDLCFSYVQTRGSVPLFWEEGGGQPFNPKITITRPLEASLPAFLRHCEDLLEHYSRFHITNLLSSKEGEAALTASYEAHLKAAKEMDQNVAKGVGVTEFDFHARSKVGGIESVKSQLSKEIGDVEEDFGACVVGVDQEGRTTPILTQKGVFRTNCKDCLDRTNAVEDSLSRFAIEDFLRNTQPGWLGSDAAQLWASHRVLWADNGDALSKIYVGTGAINSSFTRSGKRNLAGLLSDASKSVNRVFQQQLFDSGKQKAIDALLGNLATSRKVRIFNPIHDTLRARLRERASEFTTSEATTIWVGTYNLNGKSPGEESLLDWIFPVDGPEPSILVLGFQEIVPLSPQQIMSTDPEKKRRWEQHILQTLATRPDKKCDYIILRSGQLVGTALIVLCKTEIAGEMRNVEAAIKKTGVRGLAGNKGAVAIRLDYRASSFCFVTAHLAAGHSNVDERNQDYITISRGLHFARGKTIDSHDNVCWCLDSNYRISLGNDEVRTLAELDDYDALYSADQLNVAMRTRGVFEGYQEAPLLFRPTYKYDNGTDDYDTSEKMRIPAYTDRILYKGPDLDCSRYSRAELRMSDHRPVYAIFRARIRTIDQAKRAALRKELLQDLLANPPEDALENQLSQVDLNGTKTLRRLPPPSDDQQAWWNGKLQLFEPPEVPPKPRNLAVSNPFDPGFYKSSPSISISNGQAAPAPSQRMPPPAVPRKTVPTGDLLDLDDMSSTTTERSNSSSAVAPTSFQTVKRKLPPPAPRATSPSVSRSTDSLASDAASIASRSPSVSSVSKKPPPPVPGRPKERDFDSLFFPDANFSTPPVSPPDIPVGGLPTSSSKFTGSEAPGSSGPVHVIEASTFSRPLNSTLTLAGKANQRYAQDAAGEVGDSLTEEMLGNVAQDLEAPYRHNISSYNESAQVEAHERGAARALEAQDEQVRQ
ncbi:inositolor phosphatidylinositol phosphatase [Rhodotorula toruloides]|uniref:phosphoinositide 5-phosphatase n=1 Tax=Rhodotorula toruloides TaxID=5286 RepID=A0A511KGX8_RHOTO|nr:inositolor phosphatidylinositol phosphatase [Rhodotorula toruloides]